MRTLFRGTDRLFATTQQNFLIVECAQCRFLRLYPRPQGAELASFYPPEYFFSPSSDGVSQLAELYRRLVLLDHVQFVQKALRGTPPKPVLDVGSSGGLLARLLRDRGVRAIGFDNAESGAATAWRVNGVPAACADFLHAPFADQSMGAVTMFHVLEHVPDPGAYLERARRLLAPGGKLIVQVPNAASWQFLLFGERWNGLDVPRHLWNFRASDLEWLLGRCGFAVVRRKHFSLRDNPAGMATSLAPGLDPMSRRVRRMKESNVEAMAKNLTYLLLTLACLPVTLLEAACGSGSTVMIEAQPC